MDLVRLVELWAVRFRRYEVRQAGAYLDDLRRLHLFRDVWGRHSILFGGQ